MRLFVGIDVPEDIKTKAAAISAEIAGMQGRFVPVKKEAMHITLNFIGEADDGAAERAKTALGGIAFSPFRIALKGVSCFSPEFIRVVFIGVSEGKEELKTLYREMGEALERAEIRYDKGDDYTPHLTVSRVKYAGNRRTLAAFIKSHSEDDFGSFTAGSISLKQSVLTGEGPKYSTLYDVKP